MSEVPANKLVTLRYIPDITSHLSDTKAFGGLYATAPEPMTSNVIEVANLHTPPQFNQKWEIVPNDRGVQVHLAQEPPFIKSGGGPGPVLLPHAWKYESKLSGPVFLDQPEEASTFYINVFKKTAGGWIVTISPIGTFFGMESCVAASKDNKASNLGLVAH
ncbi:hypothetical protein RhiJN_06718 [Ceratobasidium sp. AG-Ba]|nr:hypothetical protein RhiJN_06718 [Ceratobasidium sp. AG-Ba]QRW07631.1 hypothetical protein RhiLY_06630 [Ceratobasidium sp. AG-Ba]